MPTMMACVAHVVHAENDEDFGCVDDTDIVYCVEHVDQAEYIDDVECVEEPEKQTTR